MAARVCHGKLARHSSIGYKVISAIPNNSNGRLRVLIQSKLRERELEEGKDYSGLKTLCQLILDETRLEYEDLDLGESTSLLKLPTLTKNVQPPVIAAAVGKFRSDLSKWVCKTQESLREKTSEQLKKVLTQVKNNLEQRPIAHQVEILRLIAKCCQEVAKSHQLQSDKAQQTNKLAEEKIQRLIQAFDQTDGRLKDLSLVCNELLESEKAGFHRTWGQYFAKLAEELELQCLRLQKTHQSLRDFRVIVPLPTATKPSIVSSEDLIGAAKDLITQKLRELRYRLVKSNGDTDPASAIADTLTQISGDIEKILLDKYCNVAGAFSLLAGGDNSVQNRLKQEIEATKPMLTADSLGMAGNPIHFTTCVLVPEGTIAELAAKGVNLYTLKDAQVLEDNSVDELVILRSFRGYSTPVIPEIRRGVDELERWYQDNPQAESPWPNTRDAVPMPVLPREEVLEAATLLARVFGVTGFDSSPYSFQCDSDDIVWLSENKNNKRVRLASKEEDLLDCTVEAIRQGLINTNAAERELNRFYKEHPDQREKEILLEVAHRTTNKFTGRDYVTAMNLHTAIEQYLRNSHQSGSARRHVFA
jgi:hypothetical protein